METNEKSRKWKIMEMENCIIWKIVEDRVIWKVVECEKSYTWIFVEIRVKWKQLETRGNEKS